MSIRASDDRAEVLGFRAVHGSGQAVPYKWSEKMAAPRSGSQHNLGGDIQREGGSIQIERPIWISPVLLRTSTGEIQMARFPDSACS